MSSAGMSTENKRAREAIEVICMRASVSPCNAAGKKYRGEQRGEQLGDSRNWASASDQGITAAQGQEDEPHGDGRRKRRDGRGGRAGRIELGHIQVKSAGGWRRAQKRDVGIHVDGGVLE